MVNRDVIERHHRFVVREFGKEPLNGWGWEVPVLAPADGDLSPAETVCGPSIRVSYADDAINIWAYESEEGRVLEQGEPEQLTIVRHVPYDDLPQLQEVLHNLCESCTGARSAREDVQAEVIQRIADAMPEPEEGAKVLRRIRDLQAARHCAATVVQYLDEHLNDGLEELFKSDEE